MITGVFLRGRPYVTGYITIPRLDVHGSIALLVDTGADTTCIHPRDGVQLRIPFNRLSRPVHVGGIGGRSPRFKETALLSFHESTGETAYKHWIEIRIGKPEDVRERLPSLLGQDVLRNWRMVHEPAADLLELHPA